MIGFFTFGDNPREKLKNQAEKLKISPDTELREMTRDVFEQKWGRELTQRLLLPLERLLKATHETLELEQVRMTLEKSSLRLSSNPLERDIDEQISHDKIPLLVEDIFRYLELELPHAQPKQYANGVSNVFQLNESVSLMVESVDVNNNQRLPFSRPKPDDWVDTLTIVINPQKIKLKQKNEQVQLEEPIVSVHQMLEWLNQLPEEAEAAKKFETITKGQSLLIFAGNRELTDEKLLTSSLSLVHDSKNLNQEARVFRTKNPKIFLFHSRKKSSVENSPEDTWIHRFDLYIAPKNVSEHSEEQEIIDPKVVGTAYTIAEFLSQPYGEIMKLPPANVFQPGLPGNELINVVMSGPEIISTLIIVLNNYIDFFRKTNPQNSDIFSQRQSVRLAIESLTHPNWQRVPDNRGEELIVQCANFTLIIRRNSVYSNEKTDTVVSFTKKPVPPLSDRYLIDDKDLSAEVAQMRRTIEDILIDTSSFARYQGQVETITADDGTQYNKYTIPTTVQDSSEGLLSNAMLNVLDLCHVRPAFHSYIEASFEAVHLTTVLQQRERWQKVGEKQEARVLPLWAFARLVERRTLLDNGMYTHEYFILSDANRKIGQNTVDLTANYLLSLVMTPKETYIQKLIETAESVEYETIIDQQLCKDIILERGINTAALSDPELLITQSIQLLNKKIGEQRAFDKENLFEVATPLIGSAVVLKEVHNTPWKDVIVKNEAETWSRNDNKVVTREAKTVEVIPGVFLVLERQKNARDKHESDSYSYSLKVAIRYPVEE